MSKLNRGGNHHFWDNCVPGMVTVALFDRSLLTSTLADKQVSYWYFPYTNLGVGIIWEQGWVASGQHLDSLAAP